MSDTDDRLARCVRREGGLILRSEQKHLPDASNVLRTLTHHRVIERLGRGVYVEKARLDALRPWERYDLEATALGESSTRILAGYSAAAVWGLWRYEATPRRHAFYRPGGGSRRTTRTSLRQVYHALRPGDVVGERLRATSLERTIVDLTRMNGFGAGFVAACGALRDGLTDRERLQPYDTRGGEGLAHLPQIISRATGEVESLLEAAFLAQAVFFGDVTLIPQVPVRGRNGRTYAVDFGVEGHEDLIELDGRGKYGASATEQEFHLGREKERADNLPTRPHRFGYGDVMSLRAYWQMLQRLRRSPRLHLPQIHRE